MMNDEHRQSQFFCPHSPAYPALDLRVLVGGVWLNGTRTGSGCAKKRGVLDRRLNPNNLNA